MSGVADSRGVEQETLPLSTTAETKRWGVACTDHQEALSIVVANFGPGPPLEAPFRRVYAYVLRKTGRKKEAQLMEQRAMEIEQAWPSEAHRGSYTVDVGELHSMRQR